MKLSGRHKKHQLPAGAGGHVPVRIEQFPTKPTKAYVAAVVVLAGLVGIHLTNGTAQALVMLGQLVFTVYGVWRAYNAPKLPDRGKGVQGFLQ